MDQQLTLLDLVEFVAVFLGLLILVVLFVAVVIQIFRRH